MLPRKFTNKGLERDNTQVGGLFEHWVEVQTCPSEGYSPFAVQEFLRHRSMECCPCLWVSFGWRTPDWDTLGFEASVGSERHWHWLMALKDPAVGGYQLLGGLDPGLQQQD
jgi:hypothetical protein